MLEINEYNEDGLATLANGGGWDVLMLNYLPRLGHGAVTQLHRHTETKETFVLLAGKVLLLTATGGEAPEEISGVMMEAGKVYTVDTGVWHATVMTKDAKILLVENSHTTAENTFRAELTDAQTKHVFALGEGNF
jgi:quercetin dioxygenase-like cupin family protein